MSFEILSDPLPGESAVGSDCQSEIHAQNLPLLVEYLVERALQKSRERQAESPSLEEAEQRDAIAQRDDGKRRLGSLDAILKDVLNVSSVSADQVAKGLRDKSQALLAERGKDLRLVSPLCIALTAMSGIDGYASAVKLAADLLQQYPDQLFPQPDIDDPDDFSERANAAADLLSGMEILALVGPTLLIDAKQAGRFTLADVVGGVLDKMPVNEVSQSDLDMALQELGPESAQAVVGKLESICADIDRLVSCFEPRTISSPRLATIFAKAISRIKPTTTADEAELPLSAPAVNGSSSPGAKRTVGVRAEMNSREDARLLIQEVIRFMERVEPSHPAPLLLKRADKLLGMSFFEIIKDMAPNALSDIERIAGAEAPH